MKIPLAEALTQLKDELRHAVLDSPKQDILLIPKEIELELMVGFEAEAKAKGGFKLFAFLDASAEAGTKSSNQHKLTLKLEVTDAKGNRVLVNDTELPDI